MQQADDAHADSLRKHPSPLSFRRTKDARPTAGGPDDDFEEHVEMLGAEREDSLPDEDAPGHVADVATSSVERDSKSSGNAVSTAYLRGDGHQIPPLHSSLGWELAHLLHVCLGQYIKPGGASPEVRYFFTVALAPIRAPDTCVAPVACSVVATAVVTGVQVESSFNNHPRRCMSFVCMVPTRRGHVLFTQDAVGEHGITEV